MKTKKAVILSHILLVFIGCNTNVFLGAQQSNWPSFRGNDASGIADDQNLPARWNVQSAENVRWKQEIPGFGHACPIVWGQKLFVTTAVSSQSDASFKHGLYGSGDASDDRSVQKWKFYCLDKKTGDLLWERVALEGIPKDKRHIKASYANATPATNGEIVVAIFGSEGVFAYDLEGNRLWHTELGRLDVGAYDAPSYEWGAASSPIIYEDLVILQCDIQQESFITALDVKTGNMVWKTERDELPSWATPTIVWGKRRHELVANGANFIRGYDPGTGQELWRLGGSSKITTPTPIFTDELIVVCSGRRPVRPIFAIRPGAQGDVSLQPDATSNESIAWSLRGKGPYIATPLIYDDWLYTLHGNGVLTCYELRTGKEIYKERVSPTGQAFTASPVASDDRIYIFSEEGDAFVIKTGRAFKLIQQNSIGERIMATPAISGGMLYIRTEEHVFAIGS